MDSGSGSQPGGRPPWWWSVLRVIFNPLFWGPVVAALVAVVAGYYLQNHPPNHGPPIGPSPTIAANTQTPAPTANSASPADVALPSVIVPGRAGAGVTFHAPQSGTYTFTIVSGAYSPWPSPSYPGYQGWTDALFVYENRPVQWGIQPSSGVTEPVSPDAQLGVWEYKPTPDEALSTTRGFPQQFSLKQGDQLIFIPVDQQGVYADNVGEVTVSVTLTP